MVVDGKCHTCQFEWDAHWQNWGGTICPKCGSQKLSIQTDEYEDYKKDNYEHFYEVSDVDTE